ncbi:glycosyltransferase family 2 protein [Methylocella silvestris]|nr:glycosyltransferase [Methylocella silvestris]
MICLPVAERFAFFQQSVSDYRMQTYPHKTLIVVLDGRGVEGRRRVCDHLATLEDPSIRVIAPEGDLTLGALRNVSFEAAVAAVVCQWDDDDRSHPRRIETQLSALVEGDCDAVFLQDVMQYFPRSNVLRWINWRATPAGGHPGTLMARRSVTPRYPVTGDNAQRGEDLVLAQALLERGRVGYVGEQPHLYLYASHGANTWSDDHHQMLSRELSISRGLLRRRELEIRRGLEPFCFEPGKIEVAGSNGCAFVL